MIFLSIIVPIYNVEKYLQRCLDSIFSQNLIDVFEVIAVNDCSTDNSHQILLDYKYKYDNLIIINQSVNKSLAVARRTGIEHSKGYYVIHVDADDWIKPNMFSDLVSLSRLENYPDVILYNYLSNDGVNELSTTKKINEFLRCDNESKKKYQHLFFGTCVNKMVKRSILSDLIYGKDYQNTTEDLIYATEVFIKSSTIVLTPKVYYNYFVNSNSLTSTISPDKYIQSQITVYKLLKSIKETYIADSLVIKQIAYYLDEWLLDQFVLHHFTSKKINPLSFAEFSNFYLDFTEYDNMLNINKIYHNSLYCFKIFAKRKGIFRALKRTLKYKLCAESI